MPATHAPAILIAFVAVTRVGNFVRVFRPSGIAPISALPLVAQRAEVYP
jgi:hypothetical protein